ncbi:hypothetical protein SAMN04490244_10932 [Tranquillimonas rosea]|uniref:Uncharacterized protein n=1 Tax=Tranquillimonas rosea TaxID=641238 RepID=A0A1H9W2L1_9RHOB|nr:hypothetical protein [Tranquillimonas rosea]SES28034.1 hypothetical protein SAMN04490244_10932 [Tranquillimonas rosea]
MTRRMIPLILGAALALTPAASLPARAAPNDLGRIIAGVAALAIVGKLIHDNRAEAKEAEPEDDRHDRWTDRDRGDDLRHRDGAGRGGKGGRGARRSLPAACLRDVPGRAGRWAGAACLERAGVPTARLPQRCAARIHAHGRERPVFAPRCLARAGYRFDRVAAGRRR